MFRTITGLSVFFLLSLASTAQPVLVDKIVGTIGSGIIMHSTIEEQYTRVLAEGTLPDSTIRCRIFEQVFVNKLMVNQAQLDSVDIPDEQVEGELDRKMRYFIAQIGSQERLEEHFKKSLLEIKSEYKELLREQMLVQNIQAKVTGSINVTPTDVRNYFNSIPPDSLPNVEEEVEASQIVRKAKPGKSEEEAVKKRLEELRQRVMKGEDFATLAVLYSEDPGSSKKGGELGFLGRGELVPEFEATAFSMKNSHEVSSIIQTQFGFHIIQLIERRGNQINARHILLKPKVNSEEMEKARLSLDSAYEAISSGKMTFEEAATKYSDEDEGRKNAGVIVNPMTGAARFEISQLSQIDPTIVFQLEKLKPGQTTKTISLQTPDGKQGYRIIMLRSRIPAHKANLKDDYQRIQTAALNDKKTKAVLAWVKKKVTTTFIQIDPAFENCDDMKLYLDKTSARK